MDVLANAGPQAERDREPAIDLRPLLVSLYDARRWIVAGALAGIVAGGIAWYVAGTSYAGAATLAISQPRDSTSPPVSIATYRSLLENGSVAAQAIKNAGLVRGSAPMSAEWFLSRVLTVEELRGTNLIRIHVRLGNPELAARVANDVARLAVELAGQISQAEGTSIRGQLKSQRDEALQNLQHAEQLWLDFRRTNQVELLRTEVDALIKQRQDLLKTEVDLAAERARAAAATAGQASRAPKLSLERRIDQDATLVEVARAQSGGDARNLLGLGLRTEELNPTYLKLDEEVALSRARIAQLERQRQEILDASAAVRAAGKIENLYAKELDVARLDADRLLSRKVYEDVALRYEQARAVVANGSAQLQIVDPALPAELPVSWSIAIWLVLGALVGAILPIGLVVGRAIVGYAASASVSQT